MTRDVLINRRRFLQSLAAVGVAVACGPIGTASPSASTTASGSPAPKAVSIEWWRRNYATGTQSAETITSDAAVKAYKDRAPNVSITIQGGPFGPETDQKFDIAILQQHAGPDVFPHHRRRRAEVRRGRAALAATLLGCRPQGLQRQRAQRDHLPRHRRRLPTLDR